MSRESYTEWLQERDKLWMDKHLGRESTKTNKQTIELDNEKKDTRIRELEEREKKLIECVRFYACGIKTHIADADYPYCSDYDVSNNLFWYGKLARQTLKELGIKKE